MLLPELGLNEKGEKVYVDDQLIDRLFSSITQTEKQAADRRHTMSRKEWHETRVRCKRDLFFLCYSVLGNTRLTVDFHGRLTNHIKKTDPIQRFREFLLFRGGFKTTIITIAHTIQTILPYTEEDAKYDSTDEPLWYPANLGTDCSLLIGHETAESAARFLYSITDHFTNNTLLMALFPECVPSPRKQRVNKWELELPRNKTGAPEPTVDTLGVGGKSQGRHYNYIKLDDIFGDKARDSEAESNTTKQWFDNIQSFFSDFGKDKLDLLGTRYSLDDIYAHAEDRYKDQLCIYSRKIEETRPDGTTYITFPEGFPANALRIIKENKKVYLAQYQNDPEGGGRGFDPSWEREYNWIDLNRLAIFTGLSREVINIRDLDIVFLIDPGTDKTGGFCITGMDWRRRIFSLSSIKLELQPHELTDLVFKQVLRWRPRTVAIESDFFMKLFKPYWEAEMRLRQLYFHVTEVKTQLRPKNDRIEGLVNYYASGQIWHNPAQEDLHKEFKTWGKSKNIHILDALAYGPEVWRPGFAPGTRMDEVVLAAPNSTDVQTGYSAIE